MNVTAASIFALPSSIQTFIVHGGLGCAASSSVGKIRPAPPQSCAVFLHSHQRLGDFSASRIVHSLIPSSLDSFVRSFTNLEFCPSILAFNTFKMRLIHSLLALATVLPTQAFTNGSLIPAYFCNPVPDGLPKSLGELIPYTVKDQCTDLAFNTNGACHPSYFQCLWLTLQ